MTALLLPSRMAKQRHDPGPPMTLGNMRPSSSVCSKTVPDPLLPGGSMGIEINGMAHVILTVSDFPAARAFYGKLLSLMGMTIVCDTDKFIYCIGGRTAIGIEPCAPEHRHERFVQTRAWTSPTCASTASIACCLNDP